MNHKYPRCQVCGAELKDLYCTEDTCQVCCINEKCPCESWCTVKRDERRLRFREAKH